MSVAKIKNKKVELYTTLILISNALISFFASASAKQIWYWESLLLVDSPAQKWEKMGNVSSAQ